MGERIEDGGVRRTLTVTAETGRTGTVTVTRRFLVTVGDPERRHCAWARRAFDARMLRVLGELKGPLC